MAERHVFMSGPDPLLCRYCGLPRFQSAAGRDYYHKMARRAPGSGVSKKGPLDATEQAAMADLLGFMAKMNAMGLRANYAEMVAAIHILQGFVIQHMLGRLDPEHWSSWFVEEPAARLANPDTGS